MVSRAKCASALNQEFDGKDGIRNPSSRTTCLLEWLLLGVVARTHPLPAEDAPTSSALLLPPTSHYTPSKRSRHASISYRYTHILISSNSLDIGCVLSLLRMCAGQEHAGMRAG